MVEVVHQTTAEAISSPFSFLYQIAQYWGYILIAIIGLILAIVIWVMWSKWEDERHERDDPVYEGYKNLIRDCELNKDRRKIRKTYSLANLLWFGLPFKRKEHSNVIIDYRDNIIGYYRGHSISQDGYYNLLAYKTKWLLFFEEIFLIRCPKQLDIRLYKKDKDGKTGCNRLIHISYPVCCFCGFIFKTQEELREIELHEIIGDKFKFRDMTASQLAAYAELNGFKKAWIFRMLWTLNTEKDFRAAMRSLNYSNKFIYVLLKRFGEKKSAKTE